MGHEVGNDQCGQFKQVLHKRSSSCPTAVLNTDFFRKMSEQVKEIKSEQTDKQTKK